MAGLTIDQLGQSSNFPATALVPLLLNGQTVAQSMSGTVLAAGVVTAIPAFVQYGTGAVERTVQDKERDLVNIKDFGAKVDNSTDDKTAIQQPITNFLDGSADPIVGSFTHGKLYFPNGVTKTSGTINVPAGSRGLTLEGIGPRGSVIHNTNTSSADTLVIGTSAGTTNDSVTVRDLQIEGSGSDGIGFKIVNTLVSWFTNLFAQNTGKDGFYFNNGVYQGIIKGLVARRAGYNGGAGTAGVAGFNLNGNVGVIEDALATECSTGVIADTGGFEFVGLDTESNILAGVKVTGVSNFTSHRGYAETASGNNNWTIGDGTNAISFARLLQGSFGNSAGVTFAKTNYYLVNDYIFSTNDGGITVSDPANTRGRIGNIYSTSLDSASAGYRFTYYHNPDACRTGNLIRNGSFEAGNENITFSGWNTNVNGSTTTLSIVSGLGHDKESKAFQAVVAATGGAGGYYIFPSTLPTVRTGYVYTLAISYTATVAGLQLNLTTGGTSHLANFGLAASAVANRFYCAFKAQGSLTTLQVNFNGVGTFVVDSITLHEGPIPQDPDMSVEDFGLEIATFRNLLASSTTYINAARQAYSSYTGFAKVGGDVPRNVTATASAGAAAGTLTLNGMDWRGQLATEALTISAGTTTTGNVAWSRLYSATGYDAGAGQTVSLGIGLKLGLPKTAYNLVHKQLNQSNMDDTAVTATLNTTYNTVALSAITAGDDVTIRYIH